MASQSIQRAIKPKTYEIIAEVGAGMNLPDDEKYKVCIQIGREYCEVTDEPKE